MPAASIPFNEAERMAALRSYDVLDSACEESFETLTWLASHLAGCPTALISLVDTERQWFKARCGMEAQETSRDASFCAHAILQPSEPLIVPDALADPRFADNALVLGPPFIRCYVGVPLVNSEGHAFGTLCVIAPEPRVICPDIIRALAGLAQSVVTTLELRRALHRIRNFALTDTLTGLPNLAAFNEAVEKAIAVQRRHGKPFGVMYLDLDRFKTINDTLGHGTGDAVLRAVADVLRATVRREDTAGRLGGDEFGIVLTDYDQADGRIVSNRVRAAIGKRMAAGGWDVTASIGGVSVTALTGGRGEVLAAADSAMYVAKADGGDRSHWCSFSHAEVAEPELHAFVAGACRA